MMAAAKQYGKALWFASEDYGDSDIVMAALKQNEWAIMDASEDLR